MTLPTYILASCALLFFALMIWQVLRATHA
jgi:hypothetical protein